MSKEPIAVILHEEGGRALRRDERPPGQYIVTAWTIHEVPLFALTRHFDTLTDAVKYVASIDKLHFDHAAEPAMHGTAYEKTFQLILEVYYGRSKEDSQNPAGGDLQGDGYRLS